VAAGSRQLYELGDADRRLIRQSDLVLIATPDDSIQKVAGELAILSKLTPQASGVTASIVLHTSGALTSEVLNPIRDAGFATGSMHPLMSISGQTNQSQPFSGIHFALEGDSAAIRLGRQLVRDLGGDSFVIDPRSKALYHAAAVMASPNLTALIDLAIEMMMHCGIASTKAHQILLPLIRSTVGNLVTQDPQRALTGTFKRGDIDTVKLHLVALASERLTDAMAAYATLGKHSLTMSGIPKSKKQAIETLLAEATARSAATVKLPTKRKPRASKSARRN